MLHEVLQWQELIAIKINIEIIENAMQGHYLL
jgi:hypothetical protein